jgi:hypothetical protein
MADSNTTPSHTVFLHGGWRCGSTYLWSKFRELPEVTAFYEPFSEKLATYTPAEILMDVPSAWDSRHPTLNQPYAAEYLPLIGERGVPMFWDSFAVQRYFVGRDEPLVERDYLGLLIAHATKRSNHAVLGFSRSLGRVRAIKQQFRGFHVVLMRDPVQQWLSCRSYRIQSGSSYFEFCHFLILALAPEGSLAGRAARLLDLPTPPPGSFKQQLRFMRSRFRKLDDELSYRVFLTVYALSYLQALPDADLIVDMDQLARPDYADATSSAIAAGAGLHVNFQDCSMPSHKTDCRVNFARVHQNVMGWLLTETSHADIGVGAASTAWCTVSEKLAEATLRVRRLPAPPPTALDLSLRFGKRVRLLFKSPWL